MNVKKQKELEVKLMQKVSKSADDFVDALSTFTKEADLDLYPSPEEIEAYLKDGKDGYIGALVDMVATLKALKQLLNNYDVL